MRYAVLSDTHANLSALEAVLADMAGQAIDATVYLGDAVGYYADSAAVVTRLQQIVRPLPHRDGQASILPWLSGNHEWGLAGKLDDTHFNPQALVALSRARTDLPVEIKEFLNDLPPRVELDLGNGLLATCIHATAQDPVGASQYVRNSEDAAVSARLIETQICLVGHTHYPRVFYENGTSVSGQNRWVTIDVFDKNLPGGSYPFGGERLILNPGSVGQPRDGDSRASYAVLDTVCRTFCVRRVTYDYRQTQERVRNWLVDVPRAELDKPAGLAGRLEWGV